MRFSSRLVFSFILFYFVMRRYGSFVTFGFVCFYSNVSLYMVYFGCFGGIVYRSELRWTLRRDDGFLLADRGDGKSLE